MGLFGKLKEPTFLKEDSAAQAQLEQLQSLREIIPPSMKERLEQEIRNVNAGIYGEQQIAYELKNSHIPMYVLHDLFLKHEDYTAQIDYLIITRCHIYVIECKNLFGSIEIKNSGEFVRTVQSGKHYLKEGIYSPITQNQRHMDVLRLLRGSSKNALSRALFEKNFNTTYQSIVVLANPKTVLNDRFAPKEIKQQVIRADQLVSFIKQHDAEVSALLRWSDAEMEEYATFYLEKCTTNPTDYTEKYRREIDAYRASQATQPVSQSVPTNNTAVRAADSSKSASSTEQPALVCPKCGKKLVLRTAKSGDNAGNQFYGCSGFPNCRYIKNIQRDRS